MCTRSQSEPNSPTLYHILNTSWLQKLPHNMSILTHQTCSNTQRALSPLRSKPQARLTEAQAIEIYQSRHKQKSATFISKLYGVNEKTVRDIWSGRTWSKETWFLDTSRPALSKQVGRPRGRRDTKLRKSRTRLSQTEVDPFLQIDAVCHQAHNDIGHNAFDQQYPVQQIDSILRCEFLGLQIISIDDQLYQWDQNGCWIDRVVEYLSWP